MEQSSVRNVVDKQHPLQPTTSRWIPQSVALIRPDLSLRAIVAISVMSIGFGLAEAIVLVLIARIAFALSQETNTISGDVLGLHFSLPIDMALWLTIGMVIARGALQVTVGWQASRIVADTLARVRRRMARAYLHTSWEVQAQEPPGRLQELLSSFVIIAGSVVDATTKGISSILSLVALLMTALFVSPLAALGFAVTGVVLGATLRPLRRVTRRTSRRLADTNLEFAAGVSELSTIGREVQVFDVVDPVTERLDELVGNTARATQRQSFLSFLFTPAYMTIMLLVLVGALVLVRAAGITDLEQLSAVMLVMLRSLSYGQLVQNVFASLQGAVPFMQDLRTQISDYEHASVDRSGAAGAHKGRLECEGLSYAYPSAPAKLALHPITFAIEPGELIGIIGPSGSGKSTLVQLLLRLRPPTDGTIRLDGTDIEEFSLRDWRAGVTFVPQEPRIIAGTVADNIRFFRSIDRDAVQHAARGAHVHEEIMGLQDGYDTVLGGGNVHLSGGQQQRLCIARALATQPWMIILDEPTSALDVFSEARIRETLSGFAGSVSTLVVAHRLSTVQQCDRIMVIQDGAVAAFDTPARLLASGGFYRDALEVSGVH